MAGITSRDDEKGIVTTRRIVAFRLSAKRIFTNRTLPISENESPSSGGNTHGEAAAIRLALRPFHALADYQLRACGRLTQCLCWCVLFRRPPFFRFLVRREFENYN